MAKQYKTIHPTKYFRDYLAHDIRPDGREMLMFRPVAINVGTITTADGSSIVKIGNTTVVCGIKAELAIPKPEEPNKGYFIPNVELPPLCSSKFRPGPPSDQAQVTTRLVADIVENAGILDLKELCVAPEKLAWVLYCDIVCLDHDGALTDACILALVTALKTVTLPQIDYDVSLNTQVVNDKDKRPINVKSLIAAATFAIFDDTVLLADPTNEEESLCTGIVSIALVGSQVCCVHKPGGSPIPEKFLQNCIEETKKHSFMIYQLTNQVLSEQ